MEKYSKKFQRKYRGILNYSQVSRCKKVIESDFEMSMVSWKKRFWEFILKEIVYEPNIEFSKNIDLMK